MNPTGKTNEELLGEIAELRRRVSELETSLDHYRRTHETERTDRARAEDLLRLQRDLGLALSSTSDLEVALDHLLESALKADGIDCAGVYIVDRSTGELYLACHLGFSDRFVAAVGHYDKDSPQANLVRQGKPVYGPRDDSSLGMEPVACEEGLRSLGVIPVHHEGQILAAAVLASRTCDVIPIRTRHTVEAVASRVGGVITRVRAEAAVREGRRNLQALFDTLDDLLFVVDSQGRIVHVNPAVERRLGYRRDELAGRPISDVHSHDRRAEVETCLAQARARKVFVCEVPLRAKDGSLVQVETKLTRGRWNGCPVVFGVSRDITERVRAAEALQKEQQLLRQLLDLHDRDRKVIAYEIHDGLAQQLAGAMLQFQSFWQVRQSRPESAESRFEHGLRLLADSVNETRRLISGLRPLILDESGIVSAVEYLICEARERGGPEIELVEGLHSPRLAPPLESAIFRVVQETLTNACRYSQSPKVRVELRQEEGRIRIEVRDWGIGFEPGQISRNHFGLQGIRERARLLGGQAIIESAPGQGTRILVELPAVEAADSPESHSVTLAND